jgi:bifunctional NMN adenylyltransferase/nudix hydrolase
MSGRSYRHAVFPGRFQPYHRGHHGALAFALEIADNVIVVIGSAQRPRTPRDPWSAPEREAMIRACLAPEAQPRVRFLHQRDYLYNDSLWLTDVQRQAMAAIAALGGGGPVALVGLPRDQAAHYLRLFPQWKFEPAPRTEILDAGALRAGFLGGREPLAEDAPAWAEALPEGVRGFLREWQATPEYQAQAAEWSYLAEYRRRWAAAPFPVIFTTVDALVVKSGHVLLVRRGLNPGKGLLALPGGFLDAAGDHSLREGALRELREETRIKVPAEVLARNIVAERAFDHPERSQRGRTITHAVCIDLGPGPLPEVRGGDDASEALWVPLAEVQLHPEALFDDHYDIITNLTSRF